MEPVDKIVHEMVDEGILFVPSAVCEIPGESDVRSREVEGLYALRQIVDERTQDLVGLWLGRGAEVEVGQVNQSEVQRALHLTRPSRLLQWPESPVPCS